MKRLIILADIKKYLPLLEKEEITTSKFAEILNELANKRLSTIEINKQIVLCKYY